MAKVVKSSFQFVKSYITKSVFFKFPEDYQDEVEDVFEISPEAVLNKKENQFQLLLSLTFKSTEHDVLINVDVMGAFKFTPGNDYIDDFLFLNAPAILFPYLRAHVSTITAVSGFDTIVLPTMNLSHIRDELKANTEVIERD